MTHVGRHRIVRAALPVFVLVAMLALASSALASNNLSMDNSGNVTYSGDGYNIVLEIMGGDQVFASYDPIAIGTNCTAVDVSGQSAYLSYGAKCSFDPGGGGAIVTPVSYNLTLGGSGDHVHFDSTFLPTHAVTLTTHMGGGYDDLYAPPAGADVVVHAFGEGDDDFLDGGDGNDTLDGGDGNDGFDPGNGSDTVNGGPGDDGVLNGDHADVGNDAYDLGDGAADTVSYYDRTLPVTVDLFGSTNNAGELGEGDDVSNTERVEGSATASNTIFGTDGNNTFWGGSANDNLRGAGGNDTIYAWEGDDDIHGGAGDDTLWPDVGTDTVAGDAGNDTIALADGTAETADCGADDDTVTDADTSDTLVGCEHTPNTGGSPDPTPTPVVTPVTTGDSSNTSNQNNQSTQNTDAQNTQKDQFDGVPEGEISAATTQPSPDGTALIREFNPEDGTDGSGKGTVPPKMLVAKKDSVSSSKAKVVVVASTSMKNLKRGFVTFTLKLNKKALKVFKKRKSLKVTYTTTLKLKSGRSIIKSVKITLKKGKARACYRMPSAEAHAAC